MSGQKYVLTCSLELKCIWEISMHRFLAYPIHVPVMRLDSGWDPS